MKLGAWVSKKVKFLLKTVSWVSLHTLAKIIKGGSLTVFQKFSRPNWTKMSEISINTLENIDEVDQIILLTTCTTKLHRYYRITLHFLDFHQKIFSWNSTPLLLTPLFIAFTRVNSYRSTHLKLVTNKSFQSALRNYHVFKASYSQSMKLWFSPARI